MEYENSAQMKSPYAPQGVAGSFAGNTTSAAPELQSVNILNRLKNLMHSLKELNASTDSAAEKIVGSAPTPLQNGIEGVKAERPPACFLDALSLTVTELERIVEVDLRGNVNRFHRFF